MMSMSGAASDGAFVAELNNAGGEQRSLRRTMRASLALSTGLVMILGGAAHAQTVTQSGPGAQTYTNTGTVVGNPRAVLLSSTDGNNVSLTIGGASSDAAPSNPPISVVDLQAVNNGTVTASVGSLTTTGTGRYYGLDATTQAGSINVAVTNIDEAGSFTRGVFARSTNGGNVTVSAQMLNLPGTEVDAQGGNTGDGLVAIADRGFATATIGTGATAGQFGSVVSANGLTGAKVTSTNATVTGVGGGAALQGISSAGNVTLDSGTVSFAGTGGVGIDTLANAGSIILNSGSAAATTAGNTAIGIAANGLAGVTIRSGTVNAGGVAIRGRSANGAVSITTSGNTTSTGNAAIAVSGATAATAAQSATITTAAGTTTSGTNQSTISVNVAGPATITNGGTVANTNGASAIVVQATSGLTTINSNTVTQTATAAPAGNAAAAGIFVNATNGGAVNITSGSVTTNGQGRDGILVNTAGPVAIESTSVTLQATTNTASAGIRVNGTTGNVVVHSGTVTTANNAAINITTTTGGIDITSTRAVANGAANPAISTNDALTGFSSGGAVTIVSDYAQSDGMFGSAVVGIVSGGTNNVSVTSNTAVINGSGGVAVVASNSGTGNATVSAGSVALNGAATTSAGQGVSISAANGLASGTIDSITALTGLRTTGVSVSGRAGASLTLRTATTSGAVANVISAAGDGVLNIGGAVERVQGTGPGTASTAAAVLMTAGTNTVNVAAAGSIKSFTAGALLTARTGNVLNNAGSITGGTNGVETAGTAAQTTNAINNSGSIVGGGGIGLLLNGNTGATLASTVVNSAGATIEGSTIGVVNRVGSLNLLNAGTVRGDGATNGGAIVVENGLASTIVNSGTLTGAGTLAVTLGAGNDSVELRTGSVVNGAIDFGAGNDTMTLNGTGTTASVATQTLATSLNLETLNVATGYWTARSGVSTIGTVGIASGATLELVGQSGASELNASPVAIGGTLALNAASGVNATVDSALSSAGTVRNIGAGTVTLTGQSAFTGATAVSNGTLVLTGTLGGDITTSGLGVFRLGAGGTSGSATGNITNNGAFVYDRSDNYTLAGNLTGNGLFTKNGTGVFTIGGTYGFTGDTVINGGAVRFTGQLAATSELDVQRGTVDLSGVSGGRQTVAELQGTSAGTVALGATVLTVNQTTSTEFAGTITGTGGLTKTGSGNLNLSGTSTYTGATTVSGGTLRINGSIASSPVTVNSGGTLGGNGTVGSLTLAGGTLSPGNSIGRLAVNGNIALNAASIYAVEANNLGQADRVDATGTATLGGAQVQVLAASGAYRPSTSYTILTAAGGVSGTFGSITSNLAFLTPSLSYSGTAVTLTLARNNIAFANAGTNANERGVGAAVQALGAGNALFEAALTLTDTGTSPAFGSLAGEGNAAITTGIIESMQPLRTAMLGMMGNRVDGVYAWGTGLANFESFSARNGAASLRDTALGAVSGIGYAVGNLDVGIGGGYQRDEFQSGAIGVRQTDVDTKLAAGYAAYVAGPASIKVGASYAWHDVDGRRVATIGGISNGLASSYDANTLQAFVEGAYGLVTSNVELTPFAGLAHVRTKVDAYAETGGTTALSVARQSRDVTYATLGLRFATNVDAGEGYTLRPFASAAYRYVRGDREGLVTSRFGAGTTPFTVTAIEIGRSAADVAGGVALTAGRFQLRAAYSGIIGKAYSNHGAKLTASIAF